MGPISHALLEREAETELIGGQLDQACSGNGSLLVVEGPAGIGKTTLLRQAMDMGRERGIKAAVQAEVAARSESSISNRESGSSRSSPNSSRSRATR